MCIYMYTELLALPDSADSPHQQQKSVHVLMIKISNLPDYWNSFFVLLDEC